MSDDNDFITAEYHCHWLLLCIWSRCM